MWQLYEPIHGVVYFTAEARAAADRAGYKGFWMGYFAFRAAPLGDVGPEIATAAFYGFHPSRARRALPDAWDLASPSHALQARASGAAAALRRASPEIDRGLDAIPDTVEAIWEASQAADITGRVLGAANQALPRPDDPVKALWQAATTLREHRGDGHTASLVACGVSPLHAHLLKIAAEETDPGALRASRNWPDAEWDAAADDIARRGWATSDGRLTDSGRELRAELERRTDAAAESPWQRIGSAATRRIADLLAPLSRLVVDNGDYPLPNPVGVPPSRA
jgi:hypothetical protein